VGGWVGVMFVCSERRWKKIIERKGKGFRGPQWQVPLQRTYYIINICVVAICFFQTVPTQELAVRKNVAVVLARAMRDDAAKGRVRELRGIEMLVQLGPQL